jgi:hypothetical protein
LTHVTKEQVLGSEFTLADVVKSGGYLLKVVE